VKRGLVRHPKQFPHAGDAWGLLFRLYADQAVHAAEPLAPLAALALDGTLFNEACKQLQLNPDQLSEGAEFQILEIWKRRDAFKAAEKKHGVPAYVMASFMLIETGMNSRLLLQANNPGGVKWRGKGKFIEAYDDCGSEKCKFQVYPSAKQGIEQWVAQTLCAPIYRMHWPSRKSDVEGWIAAYAWAGENKYNCYWSANSRKSGWKNRVNLINRYNLDKL